jgi:hypothetical protein
MIKIQDGQCGPCAHFGGDHADSEKLVQIRISHQAEPDVVEPLRPAGECPTRPAGFAGQHLRRIHTRQRRLMRLVPNRILPQAAD